MLYIYLFGHHRIFHHKQPVEFNVRPKTLSLWALLLLRRKKPIPRDSLAFALWPDAPESTARADLRRHLHHLERALPAPLDGQAWLLRQADTIQWNPDSAHWLDVAEFERLSSLPDYLEKTASLYTDDLLLDLYDDWVEEERARLRAVYLDVMRRLVAQQQAMGAFDRAQGYVHEALRRDPLDEPLVQELMRLQYRDGDRPGALKTYEMFRTRLSEELASDPSQDTVALYKSIVAEQSLPPAISHSSEIGERKHNLPATMTSFFGREEELASLHEILAFPSSPVRLITLVGPPGTGKTRLALEASRRLLARQMSTFPDGIYFVDLSSISDASLVIPAIAGILSVTENPGRPLAEQVREHLKSHYVLLILDNFEQVLAAATEVAKLLEAAPELRVLVTSREPLKLYGEHEFPVEPLPYPEDEQLPEPAVMRQYAAVTLFEARARQRQRHFALSAANAAEVAGICQCLDGLPLAVELAAGQMRDMSVSAILGQLQQRRVSLAADWRDLPQRHQTLRSAIEWSFDLLDEVEKQLLGQLSVFAGGWTLEAAESVCDPVPNRQMVDELTLLEQKNLIQTVDSGAQARWRMLATIREFALERLSDGPEAQTVYLHHADYYATLAEAIEKQWYGDQIATLLARLRLEEDNLRAALDWSLPELVPQEEAIPASYAIVGVRLAIALYAFWKVQGWLDQGRTWLSRALNHRFHLPPEMQLKVIKRLAWFMQLQADYDATRTMLEEALGIARRMEDIIWIGKVLHDLGTLAGMLADYGRAEQLLVESVALQKEASGGVLTDGLAASLNNLAIVNQYLKKYDQASSLLEEVLAFHRENQADIEIAATLTNLGNLAIVLGEHARAAAYYLEALQLLCALNNQIDLCILFPGIAELSLAQGAPERSARLYGFSQVFYQKLNLDPTIQGRERFERDSAVLAQRLGSRRFETLLAEGAAMTLDEAVAFALETT